MARHGPPLLATALISGGAIVAAAAPANAATTAGFAAGVLTVRGDNADNVITTSRIAAGTILVNGGAVAVAGGTPTVANTTRIAVFGLGGNDVITLGRDQRVAAACRTFRWRRQRHRHWWFGRGSDLRAGRQRHPGR